MTMTYILLCGGKSTRNYPHAKGIAHKCLLPFGSARIIDYILKDIIEAGGKDIIFVCQNPTTIEDFKEALAPTPEIEAKLRKNPKTEIIADILAGSEVPKDIKIRYVIQPQPKGTTHAFGLACKLAPENDAVMIFPDDLYVSKPGAESNLKKLVKEFEKDKKQILITGIEMDNVSNNSIIVDGRLIEKPKNPANFTGGFSPMAFPKELCKHMAKLADKIEAGEQIKEMNQSGEAIYTDAINSFLDEHEKADEFTLKMRIKDAENIYFDTGNLPLYEKALLYSLLHSSVFKSDNRDFLEKFCKK